MKIGLQASLAFSLFRCSQTSFLRSIQFVSVAMNVKLVLSTLILIILTEVDVRSQDVIVLISEDTLTVRVEKTTTSAITYSFPDEKIENELPFKFVNSIKLSSGRTIKTREVPVSTHRKNQNDGKLAKLKYSEDLESEADAIFTHAVKREFSISLPYDLTQDSYIDKLDLITAVFTNREKELEDKINFYAYGTGAFLVLLHFTESKAICTFYSNPIKNIARFRRIISETQTYKITEANATIFDALENSVLEKILVIQNDKCFYGKRDKLEEFSFELRDDGLMTFTDKSKRKNNTYDWQLVYFDESIIRYSSIIGNNIIVRRAELSGN